MTKSVSFTILLFVLFSNNINAQSYAPIGSFAITSSINDHFIYNSNSVDHYSLGWYNDPDGNGYGPVSYYSSFGGVKFFTNGDLKMFISPTGNVGIGTPSPTSALQIGSMNSTATNKTITIPGTYNFEQVNVRNGPNGNGELEFVTHKTLATSGGIKFYNTDGANLYLQTAPLISSYSNLAYTTRVAFNNDGSVGIGTTDNKGYLFAVNGSAVFVKATVKVNSSWPDYVFEKNYSLANLSDLEKFIKSNKHLPEVPSAKEIEKDGIDLANTQALLLKKIEELTLIVIELNKKLDDQQQEIASLKK